MSRPSCSVRGCDGVGADEIMCSGREALALGGVLFCRVALRDIMSYRVRTRTVVRRRRRACHLAEVTHPRDSHVSFELDGIDALAAVRQAARRNQQVECRICAP